jgi:hypothetical protein
MSAIAFPRHRVVLLQDLASRVLERRVLRCDGETLARDLLSGFFDVCMGAGLDSVLAGLEQAFPPLELGDGASLAEEPRLRGALVEKLGNKVDFNHGGPRNAKPRQLANCLIEILTLTLSDEPDRTLTFPDDVHGDVTAALAGIVDVELAVPQIRIAIVAMARRMCDARYHDAFDQIAAQLDDRGMRMIRQPKVPLDAVQAVQRALFDARNAVIGKAANAAIDRAKQVLATADADAAARIDLPITHSLTPRDVAIIRACDARVPKTPAAVVRSLFDSLSELAHLAWRPPDRPVRPYVASQTFAIGDCVEHPKFGRGSVLTSMAQRIEVEFAEGKHTLVHARPSK